MFYYSFKMKLTRFDDEIIRLEGINNKNFLIGFHTSLFLLLIILLFVYNTPFILFQLIIFYSLVPLLYYSINDKHQKKYIIFQKDGIIFNHSKNSKFERKLTLEDLDGLIILNNKKKLEFYSKNGKFHFSFSFPITNISSTCNIESLDFKKFINKVTSLLDLKHSSVIKYQYQYILQFADSDNNSINVNQLEFNKAIDLNGDYFSKNILDNHKLVYFEINNRVEKLEIESINTTSYQRVEIDRVNKITRFGKSFPQVEIENTNLVDLEYEINIKRHFGRNAFITGNIKGVGKHGTKQIFLQVVLSFNNLKQWVTLLKDIEAVRRFILDNTKE